MEEKLKNALEAKIQLEKICKLDFNNPKKHLLKVAMKHNVDLFDPEIQKQFKKVQE